jgi:hypothetical protein
MVVFDSEELGQLADLQTAVEQLALDETNGLQAFAPDDLVEARNRGFDLPPRSGTP